MTGEVISRSCELWLNGRGRGDWRVGRWEFCGRRRRTTESLCLEGSEVMVRGCILAAHEACPSIGNSRETRWSIMDCLPRLRSRSLALVSLTIGVWRPLAALHNYKARPPSTVRCRHSQRSHLFCHALSADQWRVRPRMAREAPRSQ